MCLDIVLGIALRHILEPRKTTAGSEQVPMRWIGRNSNKKAHNLYYVKFNVRADQIVRCRAVHHSFGIDDQ